MKEIDEKDIGKASGGFTGMQFPKEEHHLDEGRTIHKKSDCCGKFEKDSSKWAPFNCCECCVHSEPDNIPLGRYYCNLSDE